MGYKYVDRRGWGARSPIKRIYTHRKTHVVIHHSAGTEGGAEQMRSIQRGHMSPSSSDESKPWADIGYNTGYHRGTVYEGRSGGIRAIGAHTYGFNTYSFGFCFIGNYNGKLPNDLDGACEYIATVCKKEGISPSSSTVIGHRDKNNTSCPGNALYRKLPYIRAKIAEYMGKPSPKPSPKSSPPKPEPKPTARLLRKGSRGEDVKEVQGRLNQLNFNCGAIDGVFGEHTEAAVVLFQFMNGIAMDGIVGSETRGKLKSPRVDRGRYLQHGARGKPISALQSMLRRYGYPLAVDGKFGSITRRAVLRFQSRFGLTVDGLAGIQTITRVLR